MGYVERGLSTVKPRHPAEKVLYDVPAGVVSYNHVAKWFDQNSTAVNLILEEKDVIY